METLRPFFSYKGSKWRLSKYLPRAEYQTLIEPFAGSAGYSLRNYDCDVQLYEINPVVYGIWDWLINHATPEIILSLPIDWMYIEELQHFPKAVQNLMGFWCATSQSIPANSRSVNSLCIALSGTKSDIASTFTESIKERLANQIQHIKHWKVFNTSYDSCQELEECTWHFDPPYQNYPNFYPYNNIDYAKLGNYVLSRKGQVMVCESTGANWLPFTALKDRKSRGQPKGGESKSYTELVYIRNTERVE